ncbi:Oligopeptide transporter, OPT family protein [Minicystis rosea]|nr:Oligopeptide transporter, OPT family protein [Minicystis rosea]
MSDEEWYRTVYRPKELQFTVRAVVFGCLIGSVLSAANLYTGFTIGWTYGASITASISAFMVFRAWSAVSKGAHFTVLENNTMQTAASAAAAMAGAGLVNAIPALMVLTRRQLGFWEVVAWLVSVAFLGVCIAIPLKRQMINVENLKFPSGIAAAETTLALHGEGEGGAQKAKALFGAGVAGAILSFLRGGLELIPESLPKIGPMIGGHTMAKLTLQADISLLNLGAGALVGLRTTIWMAVGATVCWAGLVPWAVNHGYIVTNPDAPNYFSRAAKWCMWPGVTMLVVSGLVSFALKAKSIAQALRSLKTMKSTVQGSSPTAQEGEKQDVEVPMRWFFWGLGAASLLCIVTQYVVFQMNPLQTIVAILLSCVLALVGTRAQGETDVNPIGAMGKVTQLIFAAIAPGNPQTNLMAAGITSAGANNCGDMMQDMKTGRVLGASPRKQFIAQLFGIATGGVFTVLVFVYAFPVHLLGTKYPAPAMQTWKAMAELLTKGLGNLPKHTPAAMAVAAVLAVIFTLVAELGSKKVKRWVPSATGLGLSFILPASNSFTFLLGALLAEMAARKSPKKAEIYTIAIASGLVAGESVMGVIVALWTALHAGH